MEPERKIEKLLRAFAKKRRADAGDSPKLHPVARRMLQGEVARRYAETPEEDSVSLWQFFRQQWAFLLSFALVIFFGAALFLPALSSSKDRAQSVSAMNNLKQIGLAAQMAAADNNGRLPLTLDALTNELASDKALSDPVSGKRFVYVAGGEQLDELQSNSVLAYSPEDKKGRVVLLADGRVQAMNRDEFDDLSQQGLVQRIEPAALAGKPGENLLQGNLAANRPAAAATPQPAVTAGILAANESVKDNTGGGGGGIASFGGDRRGAVTGRAAASAAPKSDQLAMTEPKQLFKTESQADAGISSLNNNSQRFRQTLAVPTKVPPVLETFEVRQNGSTIAVVDRDGSVYHGSIALANPAAQNETLTVTLPPAEKAKDADLASSGPATVQNNTMQNNYFFRVAGQNRTSKQNVVFAGNVIPLTNVTSNAQQNQPGSPVEIGGALVSGTNGQMQLPPALFANSRITGTVTVDATNRIEINAVPVAP